jgi:hypothetical protein
MNLQAVDKWHQTRTGHLIFGLAELGLSYLFISLAINSGSLWQYALAIIFFAGSVQNLARIFKTSINERKQR